MSKILDMIEIYKSHVKANLLKSKTTALPSCTQHVLSSDALINEKNGCHSNSETMPFG